MLPSLSSRLLVSHLIVAAVALGLVGVLSSQLFRHYYVEQTQATLQQAGGDLASIIGRLMARPDGKAQVETVTRTASRVLGGRVCVFDATHVSLVTSSEPGSADARSAEADLLTCQAEPSSQIENPKARCHPGPVISVVAPVRNPNTGAKVGVILLRRSLDEVEATLRLSSYLVGLSGAAAAALAFLLSAMLARAIARPLKDMARAAAEVAEGNFDARVDREGPVELRTLAASLNHMAASLSQAFAELSGERERLADVLAGMAEGVAGLDPQGRISLANDSARGMLAVADASLTGQALADLVPDECLREALAGVLQGDADTSEATVQVAGRALRFGASRIQAAGGGAVVVIADVTESERLERLRRDFVANASHELRAPLTSIQGFLGALADGTAETDEDRARCLRIAGTQADLMRRLVDQLLDLSRLQAGVASIEPEAVDLADLARAAIEALSPQATEKALAVRLDAPSDATVHADGDRLMQVLTNLLDNAIRFSPQGGEVLLTLAPSCLRRSWERASARDAVGVPAMDGDDLQRGVTVSIRDHGPGIPEADLPLVWERFHKADPARRRDHEGTGLGLAIAREIIAAHGGNVLAQNAPDGGAILGFRLPM